LDIATKVKWSELTGRSLDPIVTRADVLQPKLILLPLFWKLNFEGSEVVYMRGMLGQYVFVIPDKRAIVVRLEHKRGENYTSQHYPDDIDVWLKAASDLLNQKENKTF
jgi:hypothetical protein